ncbi:MAG TPA: 3-isopropylmalate dehydrogenase [Balneolaceae bacterium]|nr:3-isopropylmalate dehydrogenase [Balneolaceae bacterium]
MNKKRIAVLPGDGIGPEVTTIAVDVLKEACSHYGFEIESVEYLFGGCSYDKHGEPVTDETLEACKSSDAVLLGAVGGRKWDNLDKEKRPESGLLKLRKYLGVYANFRPIKIYKALLNASSLKPEIIEGTDILIVRELTGGIYFGEPRKTTQTDHGAIAIDTMEYSENEIFRIAEKAFLAAEQRSNRICSVDKSNILDCSRLWRQTVTKMSEEWKSVELSHMLVDNCAMQLVRNPKQFDVILTGNLFGDILSDEAAMLTGSIGMLPSASIGDGIGLYEPVHGSAPDIAGQDKANPLAAIASAAMLCRHSLKLEKAAQSIENAIEKVLDAGYRTSDIYTGAKDEVLSGTTETGKLILENLNKIETRVHSYKTKAAT